MNGCLPFVWATVRSVFLNSSASGPTTLSKSVTIASISARCSGPIVLPSWRFAL